LIQISLEYSCVWHVLGRFRKLQKNNPGADLQKAHDDGDDLERGPFEALEEDSGCNDGGGGEEDVVCWCDQGGIEEVECFLEDVSTIMDLKCRSLTLR
jgi:hypothetical protein